MNTRSNDARFLAGMALLFAASAAATVAWCAAMPPIAGFTMPRMGGFPMPGGWTMPMAWMRMPGQTWLGNAFAFTVMWTTMMVAMMLPSIVPELIHYRHAAMQSERRRLDAAIAALMTGYFGVWAALGAAVYACGAAAAGAAMTWPAFARMVPAAAAMAVLAAGAWQFTPSKARLLACCRKMPCSPNAGARERPRSEAPMKSGMGLRIGPHTGLCTDLRIGLHLGLHCSRCCAGPMAALLAVGVMDLRAMIAVTVAITAERLAPDGARVARITGAIAIAAGLFLLAFPPAGGCA